MHMLMILQICSLCLKRAEPTCREWLKQRTVAPVVAEPQLKRCHRSARATACLLSSAAPAGIYQQGGA